MCAEKWEEDESQNYDDVSSSVLQKPYAKKTNKKILLNLKGISDVILYADA